MKHEIVIKPISAEQLSEELNATIDYFLQNGVEQCEFRFGQPWEQAELSSKDNISRTVPLNSLQQTIMAMKDHVGQTDIYIRVSDMTFRFCSDDDIHLFFTQSTTEPEYFFERWEKLGFKPVEWQNPQKGYAGSIVRHY
jgi:hypothetical protein